MFFTAAYFGNTLTLKLHTHFFCTVHEISFDRKPKERLAIFYIQPGVYDREYLLEKKHLLRYPLRYSVPSTVDDAEYHFAIKPQCL